MTKRLFAQVVTGFMVLLAGVATTTSGATPARAASTSTLASILSTASVAQPTDTSNQNNDPNIDSDHDGDKDSDHTNDGDDDDKPTSSSKAHGHHSLECSPDEVEALDKCTLTFKDAQDNGTPDANQTVCFTVSPSKAGTVSGNAGGNCSKTDSKGRATATFTASGSFCGKATITATDADGSAKTVVTIRCRSEKDD